MQYQGPGLHTECWRESLIFAVGNKIIKHLILMKHGDVRNTLKTDLKRRGATRAWLFLLQKFAVVFFFVVFLSSFGI